MYEYTNAIKLARAKGNLGPSATEEQIKDEYLKLGGSIASYEAPQAVITLEEPATVVEKVKKAVKKVTKNK